MTVIEDTIAVLRSLDFEADTIESTQPNFRAVLAMHNSIRAYFVWRESDDADIDFTFQLARLWNVDQQSSLGAFPSVTDAIFAAKKASTIT